MGSKLCAWEGTERVAGDVGGRGDNAQGCGWEEPSAGGALVAGLQPSCGPGPALGPMTVVCEVRLSACP